MMLEIILSVLVIHVDCHQNLYTFNLAQVCVIGSYTAAHACMTSYNNILISFSPQTASYCFQDNCKI